jgi:hypothetical protein
MTDSRDIRRRYRHFADLECRGYSEVYYDLALAVSEDEAIVGFLAELPVSQPNLFFAAIQLVAGPGWMPQTGAALRAFVTQHGREISGVMRVRRTQTNEVGRCAVWLLALPPGPLALIEVGASAGLCLLLDRYHYDFGSTSVGDRASPVHLRCTVTGSAPVPREVPRIVWRRGLDLHPIDVHDDDAVRWLSACVWADHPERRQRLERAIDLARVDPPIVRVGDLVDDLASIVADAPDDAQLVVFHSAVLSYVSAERRQHFADVLAGASRRRDIVWLSNEAPGVVPGLTAVTPSSHTLSFLLARTRLTNGVRRDAVLGTAHPHGAAVAWS